MEPFDDPFQPERVDEQIEWLAYQILDGTEEKNQDVLLIQRLQRHYTHKRQQETLEQAWVSIAKAFDDASPKKTQGHLASLTRPEQTRLERTYTMDDKLADSRRPQKRRFLQIFSTLAAVLVAGVIIGSLALVYSSRIQPPASTGARGSVTLTATPSPTPMPANNCLGEKDNDPGEVAVCNMGLVTPLKTTRTVGNATITFTQAYADTQRILIKLTLSEPGLSGNQSEVQASMWSLDTTMQGGIDLGGTGTHSYYDGTTNQFVLLAQYSTMHVPAGTTQLTLTSSVKKGLTTIATIPLGTPIPINMERREMKPHQTVTVNGQAVTLDDVIVTPSMTTISLSNKAIAQTTGEGGKPAAGTLSGNGWGGVQAFLAERRNATTAELIGGVLTWPDSFIDKLGQWTLKLQTYEGPAGQGIWTFQFTLPPAN